LPQSAQPLKTENDDDSGKHSHEHVTAVKPPRHDDVTPRKRLPRRRWSAVIGNHRQTSAPVGSMTSPNRNSHNRRTCERITLGRWAPRDVRQGRRSPYWLTSTRKRQFCEH